MMVELPLLCRVRSHPATSLHREIEMKSKALICDDKQSFRIEDVVLPDPGPAQVLIRSQYTGVSVGTEFALVRGKLSWGPFPICTGYMGVGVIEHAGASVNGFKVGQRVYYRENRQLALADGQKISGVSGVHCGHAVIEPATSHGIDHLPDGVDPEAASMFVLPSVGQHGVSMANPTYGQSVVVYGVGQVGLAVVAFAALRGCEVIAIDLDARRLEIARQLGAAHTINSATTPDVGGEVRRVAPDMADHVFECTGIPKCLMPAMNLARRFGTFTWQGNYGSEPVEMQFLSPHARQLRMYFPCDDGGVASRRAVIRLLGSGALPWGKTITHRVSSAEAPALFDRINKAQLPDFVGATVRWS